MGALGPQDRSREPCHGSLSHCLFCSTWPILQLPSRGYFRSLAVVEYIYKYKATKSKQRQPIGRSSSSPPPFSQSPETQRHPLSPTGRTLHGPKLPWTEKKKKKNPTTSVFRLRLPGGSTTSLEAEQRCVSVPSLSSASTFNFLVSALKGQTPLGEEETSNNPKARLALKASAENTNLQQMC